MNSSSKLKTISEFLNPEKSNKWMLFLGSYLIGIFAALATTGIPNLFKTLWWGLFFGIAANLFLVKRADNDEIWKKEKRTDTTAKQIRKYEIATSIILLVFILPAIWKLSLPTVYSLFLFLILAKLPTRKEFKTESRKKFWLIIVQASKAIIFVIPCFFGFTALKANPSITLFVSACLWALAVSLLIENKKQIDLEEHSSDTPETLITTLGFRKTVWLSIIYYAVIISITFKEFGRIITTPAFIFIALTIVASKNKERFKKFYKPLIIINLVLAVLILSLFAITSLPFVNLPF